MLVALRHGGFYQLCVLYNQLGVLLVDVEHGVVFYVDFHVPAAVAPHQYVLQEFPGHTNAEAFKVHAHHQCFEYMARAANEDVVAFEFAFLFVYGQCAMPFGTQCEHINLDFYFAFYVEVLQIVENQQVVVKKYYFVF